MWLNSNQGGEGGSQHGGHVDDADLVLNYAEHDVMNDRVPHSGYL